MVTPFLDGKVNYPMAKALLSRQIDAGIKAVVIAGTTGEAPTLTDHEKIELVRQCKELTRDNCIVIAAGNRITDMSISYKMSKALCNRLDHMNVCPDYNSWRNWAVNNGINDKVIAFIGFDNSRLYSAPQAAELAFATPRSWARVSEKLNLFGGDFNRCRQSIACAVGSGMAIEFEAFCEGAANMPDPDEILRGRCKQFPRSHDAMYALISALVYRIAASGDSVEIDVLDNAFRYISSLPDDFVMLFVADLKGIPALSLKLMHCRPLSEWLAKH